MTDPSTSASPRLTFTAGDENGFGAYHDLYATGSTVSRLGPAFSASVVAHRMPGLLVFDRRVAGAVHHRDALRVRRDGLDHFNLQVLRAGRMMAGAPGEEQALHPGDVAVFDTSRPQRTAVQGAGYVVVSLPRDVVEAALPGARHLHGAVLPHRTAGLLGDFVLSLARHASTRGADHAAPGGRIVADLLADAVGAAGARGGGTAPDAALAQHRIRVEAYLDAHLSEADLDVDGIAAALGLSRSALYRAFAPVGGVARRITERRLGRLRAALRRAGEHRTVAALAFELGFASESHCSRAFKAAYGLTPGRFRAEARGMRQAPESGAAAISFAPWLGDLR